MSLERVRRRLCVVSMCGQTWQWVVTYSGRILLVNRDRDTITEYQHPPKYKSATVTDNYGRVRE